MKKIITIAREFGAGGGEIGRRVAKELGIEFYDKDIILRTALANSKLDPELVRKWDERVPKSFGFAQSLFDFYNKPLDEELWQAQRDAIREMANHENCVIVGRNSEYILREFDHCLHVFAHASFQWRVKRMARCRGYRFPRWRRISATRTAPVRRTASIIRSRSMGMPGTTI